MTDDTASSSAPSARAGLRAERRTRRKERLVRREGVFDMIASGYDHEVIAASLGISVATVRRELDRAIDARRLDAPERFAQLQIARLNNLLRVVDDRVDKGDLKAVGPLLKIVAALDRYHGLPAVSAASQTPPPLALALPAPPLALTLAAPPIDCDAQPAGESEFLAEEDGRTSREPV